MNETTNKIIITEAGALLDLKRKFNSEFYANKKIMDTHDQSIDMDEIKLRAQVAMYSFNSICKCNSFDELQKAREYLVASARNFANMYNEELRRLNRSLSSLTQSEINEANARLAANKRKFFMLKEAIVTINKTLSLEVVKSSSIDIPKTDVRETVKPSNGNVPNVKLTDEEKKKLSMLNYQIYGAKLEAHKVSESNEKDYISAKVKVMQLEQLREKEIARLCSRDDAHFIVLDVKAKEDAAVRALGKVKVSSYTLNEETFKNRFNDLNDAIADMKFNGIDSEVFRYLHNKDKKYDRVTLSKDISNLSIERQDIVNSVIKEQNNALKALHSLECSEGVYNLNGGYASFKSKGGKICGVERNREMYRKGRNAILEYRDILEESLESAFNRKGNIEIKSSLPTYENEKVLKDMSYDKLVSEIETARINIIRNKKSRMDILQESIKKKLEQSKKQVNKYEPYKLVNEATGEVIVINRDQVDENGTPLPYEDVQEKNDSEGRGM